MTTSKHTRAAFGGARQFTKWTHTGLPVIDDPVTEADLDALHLELVPTERDQWASKLSRREVTPDDVLQRPWAYPQSRTYSTTTEGRVYCPDDQMDEEDYYKARPLTTAERWLVVCIVLASVVAIGSIVGYAIRKALEVLS